jgi:hypothetical protein
MRHKIPGGSAVFFPVLASIALASCSTKDPALDAVERELAVTVTMGQFDVERGQMMSSTVHVVVDGDLYPLVLADGTDFVGIGDLTRMELGRRRALIAGAIVNGIYEATYAELLPEETPKRSSDPDSMYGRIDNQTHELRKLEQELAELEHQLFNLPQTDDERRVLLEAKIDAAESKLDELRKEYDARLNEMDLGR